MNGPPLKHTAAQLSPILEHLRAARAAVMKAFEHLTDARVKFDELESSQATAKADRLIDEAMNELRPQAAFEEVSRLYQRAAEEGGNERTPAEIEARQEELLSMRPRMSHSTRVFRTHFVPGGPCSKEGCKNPSILRGWFNCWGTVYEVDLCEEHKDRNEVCGDSL